MIIYAPQTFVINLKLHFALFLIQNSFKVWYQRCLRREFWRWGVCSSLSTEIFPSADLLLSSESLPVWKAAASLPLRGRQRSNLRTTFSTHKTETSKSFGVESAEQQIPLERSMIQGLCWAGLPHFKNIFKNESSSTMTRSKKVKIPFQWKDWQTNANKILPPYESGAYTEAPAPLLHSSKCPHDRSGITYCHHSVKQKSNFYLNPFFIHYVYT